MLIKHLPLVRFLAQRIHNHLPKHIDIEDLCSAGMLGLIGALAKFDPEQDIQFATFASFRIRGAILDSLRQLDWAPRTLRQKDKFIQKAIHRLTSRFGHVPSEEQVAAELHTSLDAYRKVVADLDGLQIRSIERFSSEGCSDDEPVTAPCRPEDDPLFRCIQSEARGRIAGAIGNLSDPQRQVVTLYYYEELGLREIAQVMGLDANRTAYLRAAAIVQLRAALSVPSKRSRAKPAAQPISRREPKSIRLEPRAAA